MVRQQEMDGYTLVITGEEDVGWATEQMNYGKRLNKEYLSRLEKPPKGGRLTGTFIYSHPPDYVGRNTMTWGVSEWRELFQELKEMGIDTVIYQAAAWAEIRECYYPSKIFKDFRTWNSFDPLVEAVAKEGLTFFMGGLGNLYGFDWNATAETMARDRDQQLACFDELVERYQGGFHGFYMSPETGYPGERQPSREQILNHYFSSVCQGVKDRLPGLPILLSPGTYYKEGEEENIYSFLSALFDGCPVDDMCPQDSVGTFGNRLPHLKPAFEIWKRVCDGIGCRLWVNVESFEREHVGTPHDFAPADFRRLAVQLASAAQVGEKIVSWEVPYFYSPLAGERGIKLRADYMQSLKAGDNGEGYF